MTTEDVVLAITTLSFDIAVSEVILPLVVGAKIVMVPREIASDGAQLLRTIRERRVTFIASRRFSTAVLLCSRGRR